MTDKLEFKPTKRWIREHKYRPEGCPDKDCFCIIDHIDKNNYGFCVGITLNNPDTDLDIISFCNTTYNILPGEAQETEGRRYLWHPTEAMWIAACLTTASINAWGMLAAYRKQLGYLNRQRTRRIHKRETKDGIVKLD